jgi:preprotein translocase subunit SecD
MMKTCKRNMLVVALAGLLTMAGCAAPKDEPLMEMVVSLDFKDEDDDLLMEMKAAGMEDGVIQEQVQEIVKQRIDRRLRDMKIKSPVIEKLDSSQIRIQFRSDVDPEQLRRLVERRGKLGFHMAASKEEVATVIKDVFEQLPDDLKPFLPPMSGSQYSVLADNLQAVQSVIASATEQGLIPDKNHFIFRGPDEYKKYSMYLIDKEPVQTGKGLMSAVAQSDPHNPPSWRVRFSLTSQDGIHFGEVTEANVGRQLVVVVDDTFVMAAKIMSQVTTTGYLAYGLDEAEALELAIILNSGPHVVPVQVESIDVAETVSDAE